MRTRRVLGYARVSSQEQALGSSLRDQQAAIERYAQTRGLKVARVFVEAESAIRERLESRQQMRALMAEVGEGDLIVVDKLDRWSRDPEYTYTSIRRILERKAGFYSVSDGCDPSTRDGDTMLNFRVLFAKEEHKRIKERMVGTRKLLKAQGLFAEGAVPFGYRRSHPKGTRHAAKNILVVEPAEADLVRRMFKLCASGRSLRKIAALLEVSEETVTRALSNRIYLGEMRGIDGTWARGQHAAIVDADLFSRAETSRAARRLGGPRTRDAPSLTDTWILREVAYCGACGRKMASSYAGPKGPMRRFYYRCPNAAEGRCEMRAHLKVRDVEAQVGPLVVARLDELREQIAKGPEAVARPVVDHAEKRAKLARRRAKFLEAFADDMMTKDELRERLAKLDTEGLRLDAEEIAAKRVTPLADPKVKRTVLRELGTAAKVWAKANPKAQRTIIGLLADVVRLNPGKPPAPVWKSAENLAQDDGQQVDS